MQNLVHLSRAPADQAPGGKATEPKIRRKLIEVALPLEAINAASSREKSIRHCHPSTLHLWWSRKPLATCRAVLFAQLVDDPSAWPDEFPARDEQDKERTRLHKLIGRLVPWEATNDEAVLNEARFEIARSFARGKGVPIPDRQVPEEVLEFLATHIPPVYDPFCGGGSIPLEAQRLGLRAMGSDLNPVAVMITKALIEFPPKFKGLPPVNPEAQAKLAEDGVWNANSAQGLAEDVRYYSQWMRDRAAERIGELYPKARLDDGSEATVIAWLWVRTVASPNPAAKGAHVPLTSKWTLSTKKGKEAWVEPVLDGGAQDGYRFEIRTCEGKPQNGTVNRQGGRCLLTGAVMPFSYIRAEGKAGRMGSRLMAIVAEGKRSRIYLPPDDQQSAIALSAKGGCRPDGDISHWPGRTNVVEYGMTTFADLFTPRQLVALTTFSDLVTEARAEVLAAARKAFQQDATRAIDTSSLADGGRGTDAYADAVAVYLAFAVDRLADRSSSLCGWDAGYVKIRNTFSRQALPMVWDYADGNPFSESTGNWTSCVTWIEKVLATSPTINVGTISQHNARLQPNFEEPVLMIATDPPYYDNIGYADLSDFFYVWLRRSIKKFFPKEFAALLTPKGDELIASPYRHDRDREKAQIYFETGMRQVIRRMHDEADNTVPVSIYYAFKQSEIKQEGVASTGWATFLEGVIQSGFQVDGTWPTRTELSNRMLGHGTNALASSIVLVCRKRPASAKSIGKAAFLRELRQELPPAILLMLQGAIAPVDLAQASIGPGMAVFSRYAAVLEQNDSPMPVKDALKLINAELDVILAEQEGDYDSDSRFALTWFKQHRFEPGPFGDANTIANARDVSVKGVEEAGLIEAKGGKVRLLKRGELEAHYDPWKDDRPTVWEGCQHLIKRLEEQGEEAAARLAKKLGYQAAMAKDLAYRLYQICERKGWAEEARAYNGLVIAWPEIQRIADSLPDATAPVERQSTLPLNAA